MKKHVFRACYYTAAGNENIILFAAILFTQVNMRKVICAFNVSWQQDYDGKLGFFFLQE
jgi:hypothetical protein